MLKQAQAGSAGPRRRWQLRLGRCAWNLCCCFVNLRSPAAVACGSAAIPRYAHPSPAKGRLCQKVPSAGKQTSPSQGGKKRVALGVAGSGLPSRNG